ncbi:MAG: flagellar hook-basal body complex protein [Oribacterium sp.]|nr:flagellar hook-basal body complex protein [Oribacterium sp.]
MLRAMDSAVSGLRAHQSKLDIIGNNIANVNTAGYKSQAYSFKDAVYQTSSESSKGVAPSATTGKGGVGGTNAAQYGYGSVTGSIATDFTSSIPTYVGGFNAAINGTGFFVTKAQAGEVQIKTDTDGVSVINNNYDNKNDGLAKSTAANYTTDAIEDDDKPTTDAKRASNNTSSVNSSSTLIKNNEFSYTRVGQLAVDANGYIVDSNGNYVYGYRADMPTNVDTTYGSLFTTSTWQYSDGSAIDNTTDKEITIDEKKKEKVYALRLNEEKDTSGATNADKSFVVYANDDGSANLSARNRGSYRVLAALRAPNKIPKTVLKPDGNVSYWSAGDYTGTAIQLKSVSVANDGIISASIQDTDGTTKNIIIGKLAIANFQNEDGLTKAGNNTFVTNNTDNTGVVTSTVPGGATSKLMAGYIEASNVDLAREFSDMITTERGLQANTKIITVSDEVLQEIVNMKR